VEFGFDKSLRLLNAGDYQAVFDQSRLKVSTAELLFLANANGLDHPRLGLVVAKKNVRLAAQRNRLKRIVRESFRMQQSRLPVSMLSCWLERASTSSTIPLCIEPANSCGDS